MPNFHEVHPFLYRGGEPTGNGLEQLQKKGITCDIDLRSDFKKTSAESEIAKRLHMKYVNLPMTAEPPTPRQVNIFLKLVKQAQDNPGQGPVFVHCAHGSDRTGCMVGIWRVSQENWNYEDTYKEMRKYYYSPKFTRLADTVYSYWCESNSKDKKH